MRAHVDAVDFHGTTNSRVWCPSRIRRRWSRDGRPLQPTRTKRTTAGVLAGHGQPRSCSPPVPRLPLLPPLRPVALPLHDVPPPVLVQAPESIEMLQVDVLAPPVVGLPDPGQE